MKPHLKFYLSKNPNYGKQKPPFISPTLHEYEEYLDSDSGGISSTTGHISSFERYVERAKERYEQPEEKIVIMSVVVCNYDNVDEIESQENFIKWCCDDVF